MNYYLNMLTKKYADFGGRASRREYWTIVLCNVVIGIIFAVLMVIFSLISEKLGLVFNILYYIYCFAILIPILALGIRRLHDIGKSGVWYLINFIPFIGAIWFLVLMCTRGNSGTNEFGAEPQE